jgi:hypothetical protein
MRAGLCDACSHQRLVRNTRGSTFSLCERAKAEPAFAKYPPVPVLACPGFEPVSPAAAPRRERSPS